MKRVSVKYEDYDCMYNFRTRECPNKNCKKGMACFDIHPKDVGRRVPKQLPNKENLFNYIPKACPEYKKSKKCSRGDACQLAHSWLEIIYHPLLFKTKLCDSSLKNGICREYGIYCAKAHNENEIRNLVKIYGEDWKRHYEAYQICSSVKSRNKKAKEQPADVRDSSNSPGSSREDDFPYVTSTGMSDLSSQMYGGSPLFVPTPPDSPFKSMDECNDSQEGLMKDQMLSIVVGHESTVGGREVGAITKYCDTSGNRTASNPRIGLETSSSLEDGFPWEFGWSSARKAIVSKESVSTSSISENLKSFVLKDTGSRTSGGIHPNFLLSETSTSDQETEIYKTKKNYTRKVVSGRGISKSENLQHDQVMNRSMQDFDQQDWELKLGERRCENEINAGCVLPMCKTDQEKLVDETD